MTRINTFLLKLWLKASCNKGLGTLEVILIIFVLIGFVILFREKMLELITKYLDKMDPKL